MSAQALCPIIIQLAVPQWAFDGPIGQLAALPSGADRPLIALEPRQVNPRLPLTTKPSDLRPVQPMRATFASVSARRIRSAIVPQVRAVTLLWAATAAGALLTFLTQLLLARTMGPSAYGLFASSLSTVTMIAPMAGFGVSYFWLSIFGQEGPNAYRWLHESMRLVRLTSALALAVVLLWALLAQRHPATTASLLLLSPVLIAVLLAELVSVKLRLEERYGELAIWQLSIPAARFAFAVLLAVMSVAHEQYSHIAAFAYALIAVSFSLLAWKQLKPMLRGNLRINVQDQPTESESAQPLMQPSMGEIWSRSWPFGLETVLYTIFLQVSTVSLKYLADDRAAGFFNIALSVILATYLLPTTVYQKYLLPKLFRWASHAPQRLAAAQRLGFQVMLAGGVLVMIALWLIGPTAIRYAYGSEFRPVAQVLSVLAVAAPLRFASTAASSGLLTTAQVRFRAGALGAIAAIVGGLNYILIPTYGALGSSVALVLGELLLLLAMLYSWRRVVRTAAPEARLQ